MPDDPKGPPDHPGNLKRVKVNKPDTAFDVEVSALIDQGYEPVFANETYVFLYKELKKENHF